MPELVLVKCEVCGFQWDPRGQYEMVCLNSVDHPTIHKMKEAELAFIKRLEFLAGEWETIYLEANCNGKLFAESLRKEIKRYGS